MTRPAGTFNIDNNLSMYP